MPKFEPTTFRAMLSCSSQYPSLWLFGHFLNSLLGTLLVANTLVVLVATFMVTTKLYQTELAIGATYQSSLRRKIRNVEHPRVTCSRTHFWEDINREKKPSSGRDSKPWPLVHEAVPLQFRYSCCLRTILWWINERACGMCNETLNAYLENNVSCFNRKLTKQPGFLK